ncbi:MAG: XRE family transcriptional regulator [SAR324 cluster bacterium]|nr:XRE family transcriptional regulator [SAR324 cluster bacterium]
MEKQLKYQVGSGNVFEDLGVENPDEYLQKAKIASLIYDIIESKNLNQKEAGLILGINQPKISSLKNGRLEGFSIERLFKFLNLLDQDIDIVVRPKAGKQSKLVVSTSERFSRVAG